MNNWTDEDQYELDRLLKKQARAILGDPTKCVSGSAVEHNPFESPAEWCKVEMDHRRAEVSAWFQEMSGRNHE